MSSLIDIARSGIMAYRTAMAVTTENVANVNTEGYVRRDVLLSVQSGTAMSATSMATLGQGVQVTDVRRAFDSLTADRLRASESTLAAAGINVASGQGLEQAFLPGADGIDSAMAEFFGGLNALASYPGDVGLRRVVMEMGAGVAASFTETASSIDALQEDAYRSLDLSAAKVTSLLSNLSDLNDLLKANKSTIGAGNPVQDRRDAALSELARQIGISVTLDDVGRAEIRLGQGPGGVVLLDKSGAATVRIADHSPLRLEVSKNGTTQRSTALAGGEIGGQVTALAAIASAKSELDQLAQRFTEAVNSAHASGVDLDGRAGQALFSLDGIKVIPGVTNSGGTAVTLSGQTLKQEVHLSYDANAGHWVATSPGGEVLGTGQNSLSVGGSLISLEGPKSSGDSFVLKPTVGQARDMAFVLTNPRAVAAAAALIVAPAAENRGTSSATIKAASQVSDGLQRLDLTLSANPAEAVEMLQPGVVGVIPAGASSASLYSLARQSAADFPVSNAFLADGGILSVITAQGQQDFAFSSGLGARELAQALNDGSLVSTTGLRLSDAGMMASGADGAFSLSLAAGNIGSASINTLAGSIAGQISPAQPKASEIQVFTRDGRQVAGSPLTAAQAAALLTEANGFSATAVYDNSTLNGASGSGYRATQINRQTVPGPQALVLSPQGATGGNLTLQSGETTAEFVLPESASARRIADELHSALPGLSATAETNAILTALGDGTVQFDLAGTNVAPVRISAVVNGGDYGSLVRAINAASAKTGIVAELSTSGDRILLRHQTGEDIRISGFEHSAGSTLTVQPADGMGQARGVSETLGTGTSPARISGQVSVSAPSPFTISGSLGAFASTSDVYSGNMVERETFLAGDGVRLKFSADSVADSSALSSDGLIASAAGLSHNLIVNGVSVTVNGGISAEGIAKALLTEMRELAPNSSVTGTSVSALPQDGLALPLTLDGQQFVLRMENGLPIVNGPEAGRISASFDASNRLQISVNGGVTDGIGVSFDTNSPAAAAFGLTGTSTLRVTGQPIEASSLPLGGQIVQAKVGGAVFDISIGVGPAVVVPPGFPGSATINGDGALELEVLSSNGPLQITSNAAEAGFSVAGVQARVVNEALELIAVTEVPPQVGVSISATASERLTLSNLPPEDLIVVLNGAGALRLAGSIGPVMDVPEGRATEIRVTDAATGAVELFDSDTGHSIASGWLNSEGKIRLSGNLVSLTGQLETGDRFLIAPNRVPEGDARTLQQIIALAEADPSEGGGFSRILAELTTGIGAQLDAAKGHESAVSAGHETLMRKMAEVGAVDLDTEAARLIELQQAYQASAQALSIARQLFDTIMKIM